MFAAMRIRKRRSPDLAVELIDLPAFQFPDDIIVNGVGSEPRPRDHRIPQAGCSPAWLLANCPLLCET